MRNRLKSVLLSLLFYALSIASFVLFVFIDYQFFNQQLFGGFLDRLPLKYSSNLIRWQSILLFFLPVPVLMFFSSRKILSSERELLKWKIPSKISLYLAIALIISLILLPLSKHFLFKLVSTVNLAILWGLLLSIFYVSLLSWLTYYLSEKSAYIILIFLLGISLVTIPIAISSTTFCLDLDRERCLLKLGIEMNDPSFCEESRFPHTCYTDLAVRTGDYTICGEISSEPARHNCYSTLSTKLGDPEICKLVTPSEIPPLQPESCCLGIYLGSYRSGISTIENLTEEQKISCGL